jgi:hypothetical protein
VRTHSLKVILAGVAVLLSATPGFSAARRNLPGFSTNTLPANDDSSTAQVPIGFTINLFGTSYGQLYVNNNGNVTFDGPLSTFTPFGLNGVATKIIAPFFADVDTRGPGSGLVTYGNDTVNGHNAFGVEWPNVGYYSGRTDKLNTFELVIIDRSDIAAGAFDFEFNYDQIQWETGEASGGVNGLGGNSARVGYSNGLSGTSNVSFELAGSAVNGAFLNGGSKALVASNLNSSVLGRYLFSSRGGTIDNGNPPPAPTATPATTTPVLLLSAVMLVGIVTYMKRTRTA